MSDQAKPKRTKDKIQVLHECLVERDQTIQKLALNLDLALMHIRNRAWILLEEQAPSKSYNYLVFTPDRGVEEASYFADEKKWDSVATYGYDSEPEHLHNVTHWKTLPDPPKVNS